MPALAEGEYGGRGATPIEKVIWQQEEGVSWQADAAVPDRRRHVRADRDGLRRRGAKRRYLPKLVLAKKSGASCSPEPAGGSDVAGLRDARRREGRQLDRQRP